MKKRLLTIFTVALVLAITWCLGKLKIKMKI